MGLQILPAELLLTIAETLEQKDVNSLLRSSRRLSLVLTPLLHKLALREKGGIPALSRASMNGHELLVRLILSKEGAYDIDAQDGSNLRLTALHRAVLYRRKAIVCLLLEHGAYVDAQDKHGQTPFTWCLPEMVDMAQILLDHGADVDARSRSRATMLHRATWGGNVEMVRLLLEKGANILVRGEYGQTAFDDAAVMKNKAMVEVFLDTGRVRGGLCRKGLLRWADRIGWGEIARTKYGLHEEIDDAVVDTSSRLNMIS